MASVGSLLSEENFLCSICLDVFTEPITTPCGHNFCKGCITRYWDTNACRCPLCNRTFCRRPEVTVNTFISDMVDRFRSHKLKEQYEGKTEAEVQQMIREREVRIQEVKLSVESCKSVADREIGNSVQVFSALMNCIERSQAELIHVIEEKKRTTEKQADGIIKDLQQEINELKKRNSELRQLSQAEDPLHLLQNVTSVNTRPAAKDWAKVNVHPSSYVGTVRTAVAQLEKTLSQEMEKLCSAELRRIQQYAGDAAPDLNAYK